MSHSDEKRATLHAARALNTRPEAVVDPAFTSGDPFFDARDLVQVKYEMLRRVQVEGQAVAPTAAAFGFSRPSFYAAQTAWQDAGLPGLIPARPGPRGGHKLTAAVVDALLEQRVRNPQLRTAQLAALVQEQFGLVVHPRSIERALARHTKKARGTSP